MENEKRIAIIDYNLGNLFSVYHACTTLGYKAKITNDKKEISEADFLILPGVGAFGDAMNTLHQLDLVSPILDFINSGKPFLGVCLGLQLLFSESEEFGAHKGLNIIEGTVKKFPDRDENRNLIKVPQIQWNQILCSNEANWKSSPLRECKSGDYMYFVHSYYVKPASEEAVVSSTEYVGITYCSSSIRNNVFASQFHPEKSGEHGLDIYKCFLNY